MILMCKNGGRSHCIPEKSSTIGFIIQEIRRFSESEKNRAEFNQATKAFVIEEMMSCFRGFFFWTAGFLTMESIAKGAEA